MEAAGFEPASASAPSVRFYEHSSRFSFTCRDGPGRRREASPLGVPSEFRARTPRVSPLNDTGNRAVGRPGRWASLFRQRVPAQHYRWRVSFAAGVLRVSSKLGSSHRTLTTPVEAYCAPLYGKYSTILEGILKQFSTPRPSGSLVSRSTIPSPAPLCRPRGTATLGGRVLRPWRRIETTC